MSNRFYKTRKNRLVAGVVAGLADKFGWDLALARILAIILMAIHALWAIWTYWKGNEKAKKNFSRFSVFVWAFWLIPYIGGIFLGASAA